MLKFMFDINICIFMIKNKFVSVRECFNLNQGRMCISLVILMEVIYGVEKSQMFECNFVVIEGFVFCIDVLDYDVVVVIYIGQIRVEFVFQGCFVGLFD